MGRLCAVFFLSAFALPSGAWAAANYAFDLTPADTGIAASPLTGNPNMTLRTDGYAALTIYANYVRASATSVTMACTGGPSAAVQAPLGVSSVAPSGLITQSVGSWTMPVSASGMLPRIVIAPANDRFIICTFTGAGAAAGDLLSVYARLGGAP
jgi:hypothetical protein